MYYILSTAYTRRKGQLSYTDNRYTVESCEVCNGNFVNYSEPINFEIKGKICDFYSFDNINIISQEFLEVLKESRITGYEIRSAECLNLNSVAEKPVKYYEMIITGRCGLICNMDFGERYGDFAKGFIHIHHLKLPSSLMLLNSYLRLNYLWPACH